MGMQGLFGEAVDRIGGEPISARMARRAPIRHLDPMLLTITLLLSVFGAVMVFSATANKQDTSLDPAQYLKRQIAYAIAGAIVLLVVSFIDYRHLRAFAPFLYGGALVTLLLLLTPLGDEAGGARSWFNFGFFQVQPSEFAKIAVIVAGAAYLAERKEEVRVRDVAVVTALVAAPSALIYVEPDFGSALVFVALLAGLLLLGGAKIRHFLFLAMMALLGVAVILQVGLLKDYQIERITAFLDSSPDVQSEGWTLHQAKTAIASGGLRGKGFQRKNTQTSLDFVPEQHTDFIFTAVAEQLGFIGAGALLGLFALLIWRALRIATLSRDLFGTLLAGGIATMWVFQMFVNVGMTMGIMPITGLTLPFVSFGGSSLVMNFMAVGILLNVHMRRYL
ncbi:MAG: rod shape-determining protein RodA [Actinobacteria bacterium]|nr:rod shape-determining protein RodA [Actinomycetota bacterium]